jgi:uncharacterized phage-associated protein
MPSVHDVARFILQERGEMTAMKLHKLLYYAQAWNLVWDEKPLFTQRIEAWANGPVVPAVYALHRGRFAVASWPKGSVDNLSAKQQRHIRSVLKFYGGKTAQWLSELTHREQPWVIARKGLAPFARGDREITTAAMHEYYSSL